ncbi:RNA-directed DNA polymerase [Parvibaculum sp.]|uniref:RNA-directed DNA polymerase n=1 Tax=Parvibaculum sp. TaxID=2024848 RepID=UPI001B24CF52|nr:RNA-directed DNA polymerase [Parvibaculum sp.]MBO6633745.1 RNA-directed DNA polymerase [Parvibaculum sp.]MBO6677025.1 RNA-directed DNA polymerase [Parvibaculum sp.]MBO6683451.1 RNA-directed DNA polymerase [Parvibaculum sp.]MBO6904828.1 RNA-directed DNA polymerase [Parvibaculum sp.]
MTAPSPERMIKQGFLPENLPPAISSVALWPFFQDHAGGYLTTQKATGALSPYNASKRGNQRRLFSLPHPSFFFDQSLFFERNWDVLKTLMETSPGSLSVPQSPVGGPRALRITPHSELPKLRLKALSRFKFCLVTDVARFFPSVYTHSIPWAINGKTESKKDPKYNSAEVFGNRLDFAFRQAQDRQTVGIPVGPDTSRATSELILSAVDRKFLEKSGKKTVYLRHVDDYWIGGNSIDECERHLRDLRASLKEYELDINELKTKIVPTNHVFGDSWPSEFEEELVSAFGDAHFGRRRDPVAVLGKIIDTSIRENDDGMIKHAIRKLDEHRLWGRNWEILEHFLAQNAVQFTHSFDYSARVVAWRIRIDASFDSRLWSDVAQSVAMQGSGLGRDSEVLWALWLLKELKVKIPKRISDLIVRNNNSLVLGYLAHLYANGLTRDGDLRDKLENVANTSKISGVHWPLILEMEHLEIGRRIDALRQEDSPATTILKGTGASLVDWDAAPKVFEEEEGNDAPLHAIEDYTSDYDFDDEDDEDDFDDEDDPF